MDEMADKLGSILNDPQMMQQIMNMAQTLGQSPPTPPPQVPPAPEPTPYSGQNLSAGMDTAMLQRLYAIARQSGIDKDQQALLRALGPYLSRERIAKLEKAMRAARLAALAATALSVSPSGR